MHTYIGEWDHSALGKPVPYGVGVAHIRGN
jgi:hypothetical protein